MEGARNEQAHALRFHLHSAPEEMERHRQKLDQELPGPGSGERGLTIKGREGIFCNEINIPYLDCGGGLPTIYVCQNSYHFCIPQKCELHLDRNKCIRPH